MCVHFGPMDSQSQPFNGNSQRRKLVKKPPSHQYAISSSGLDGGYESHSLQSQRSSQSLRRAPSAPPARSSASNASSGSSPRHPPALSQRSNASPSLAQGEFSNFSTGTNTYAATYANTSANTSAYSNNTHTHSALPHRPNHLSDPHQRHIARKASEDFIGAPFDGAAILNRIESTKVASPRVSLQRPNVPPPLSRASPDPRLASRPALRTSVSYGNMDSSTLEKIQAVRGTEHSSVAPKRYSDDGKDLKSSSGTVRKKSGFSGFVNSLVGSQKKPVISAPENPVHVTHVGYDSNTGQFTVSIMLRFSRWCPPLRLVLILTCD